MLNGPTKLILITYFLNLLSILMMFLAKTLEMTYVNPLYPTVLI